MLPKTRYSELLTAIAAELQNLNSNILSHGKEAAGNINWGHVADMSTVLQLAKEINEFLTEEVTE